ncbi:BCSC C-terminal domain-containing protein [Paraburkholderia sp. MMS20-SJTR3]|uniref:BCSC C-terminal domain-containing protein n=1 Tax=Paraburkholderia sejongensis TaxID=2886946 RepID=A0ABS8JMG8_9BURK|nr:cellulose synthase subunit BcsC-related outer membrane protein [Paraburkholderia sp. MMS20-SJTR3]MCC8391027.1 BCSC C-terminal domain-containing protein [Paraburkholderia sp. MMS20-SJTR3]
MSRRVAMRRAARLGVLAAVVAVPVAVSARARADTREPEAIRAAAVTRPAGVAGSPATAARVSAAADFPPPADPAAQRLLATARMWSTKHRDDLALQAIDKALLVAPADPALLAGQARIQLRLGRAQAAQATLAKLRAKAPDNAATQQIDDEFRVATNGREELATVRLLARSGQSAEAVRRLQRLFPHGAPSGSLGAEYYQILAGTPDGRAQALAALHRRVAADPGDLDAALVLANLLNARADTRAEANRIAWNLATRPDSDRGASLDTWRHVLQSAGADPAYLAALRAYLQLVPDDSEFRERVGVLEAQLEAQRQLERNPDYIAQQRGLQALAHNDLAAAETLLARAAQARPDDAQALGGLGLARMRAGRHDEARALFLRAAALAPDNRGKWEGLARTAQFWGTLAQGREAAAAGRAQDAERAARAALAQQPDNADAQLMLADALLAQHDWPAAEPLLRKLLNAREPNLAALRSTQTLFENTGRAAQIEPLLDALQSRFTTADARASVAQLRADLLAKQADQLLADGARGPAAQRYEAALRSEPDAPWTRFALARLYRDLGLPQLGRAVMDEGLALSGSPQMRYASALYRNSLDDVGGAQAVLALIAEPDRSDGMRALERNLHTQQRLADARAAFARDDREATARALDDARTLAGDDPNLLAAVGAQWIDAGEPDRGLALLGDWLAAHPREAQTDVDLRLRYGDLLGSARRDDELTAWLQQLRDDRTLKLDAAQTARLEDQALRAALRETDAALDREDFEAARQRLATVSAAGRRDRRYTLELADLQRAQGDYAAARATLAPLLAAQPDDADARLALARVLEQDGERRAALRVVHDVLENAAPDDIDTRLAAARRLAALNQPRDAQQVTAALRVAYPARADVTVQSGRIAADLGHYEDAVSLYRLSLAQERASGVGAGPDGTPAQAALADLEQRRNPLLETGWLPAYKSGDAGISRLSAWQVPVYVQIPYRYDGHFFAHIDTVRLDPGKLDLSAANQSALDGFGTIGAADRKLAAPVTLPNGVVLPGASLDDRLAQLAKSPYLPRPVTGVALGAGYTSDAWRVDAGTTPLGFPVHYLVGGVRYRFDLGPASFSVSGSRRPVTSSQLSYAGMQDPVTGIVWGGVRRDGIDQRASVDVGTLNLFAELGLAELTGRNVASNQELTLRSGFSLPVWRRANSQVSTQVSTGLVGNAWHYTNNLRFYSYGQGGYYSPQRYLSLGVPLEWIGRRGALKWDLSATLGVSNSYEKSSPYYPIGLPSSPSLNGAPAIGPYEGGSTRGVAFSYGVAGSVEYRFNPHLQMGAQFSIDRSHDYAPSAGLVYLRYTFDSRKQDYRLSPQPVRLYSSY